MTTEQLEYWTAMLDDSGANSHIVYSCVNKMEKGCAKYGDWDAENYDERDLYRELEQELLDSINYIIMALQKNELKSEYNEGVLKSTLKQIILVLNYLNTFS